MLFPLSKSFTSSKLFQRGGAHEEPLPHRLWHGGSPGSEERVYEVHRLLTERKPFAEQLRLAQQRTEALRRKDAEFSRAHSRSIKEMQQRIEEQALEARRDMQQGAREQALRRARSDTGLAQRLQEHRGSYQGQRADMEARVRALPPLCGDSPTRESLDRTEQRSGGLKVVNQSTREYFEERRAVKQRLTERPRSVSMWRAGHDAEAAVEERKTAGLASLSKTAREYEAHLEGLYEKHADRVAQERQARKADFQAHLDHRLAASQALAATWSGQQQRTREEEARAKEDRLQTQPRGYAGYAPKAKSDRRVREEAAEAEIGATLRRS